MELAGKEECSLGYSKLTYEEYIENPEVYLARGILAPKWANELYGKGYKGVCAIDFYDDIFGGDLEEHRMPEDYRTGEYAAIAIEQVKQVKDGKGTIKGRRITVTQDQEELYDLIEESEKKTLQKKGLQASEAISQAEEWKNQAEKSEIQIQKLLSEKQELVSTVAEQGKRIAEQTEQIEKLNEADNVLKLNAELKKQNEKLKQDKLNAEQEAEATVSSVKREYEAKGRELDRRIGEAAKQSASLKSERQSISEDIEQRATAKYLDQKKELDRKFKAQTASYDSFLLGLLLYGVLTTVFTAVRSEAFVSDFKTFFMVIWQFIVNAFQLLLKGGQWASQLGDKIPQPVVATIVHYLLLIVFVGGIAIGVGFLIFLGASKVFEFYTEDYADTMSLAVFLISLAVSVYFAEPIRAVIPINLLLLLILVHIVYVLIRWYVKGCMRSRGYY